MKDYAKEAERIQRENEKQLAETEKQIAALKAETERIRKEKEAAIIEGDYKTFKEKALELEYTEGQNALKLPELEEKRARLKEAPLISPEVFREAMRSTQEELNAKKRKAAAEALKACEDLKAAFEIWENARRELEALQRRYFSFLRDGSRTFETLPGAICERQRDQDFLTFRRLVSHICGRDYADPAGRQIKYFWRELASIAEQE